MGRNIDRDEEEVPLTTWQVIWWWEIRRPVYNIVLLVVGCAATFGMIWLMSMVLPPGEDAEEPLGLLLGFVLYALMANACYTLGWILELRDRKIDAVLARQRGAATFRRGFLLSIVFTSLPFWYGCVFWITERAVH